MWSLFYIPYDLFYPKKSPLCTCSQANFIHFWLGFKQPKVSQQLPKPIFWCRQRRHGFFRHGQGSSLHGSLAQRKTVVSGEAFGAFPATCYGRPNGPWGFNPQANTKTERSHRQNTREHPKNLHKSLAGSKFPPGMYVEPLVNNGMNYHVLNWCLPDFWQQ